MTPTADTLSPGDTLRLSAKAEDANGHPMVGADFVWTSSHPAVVTVDDAGLVTAAAAGEAEATATSVGAVVCAMLVVTARTPATIKVTPGDVALPVRGGTVRSSAEVRDQLGRVMEGDLGCLGQQQHSGRGSGRVRSGHSSGRRHGDHHGDRRRSSPLRDVIVLDEPEKGTGCAADTGFRYAIARGAEVVYRTDADCLPRPTWLGELCKVMADGGPDAAGGKLLVRTDDIGLSWWQLIPSRIGIRLIGPLGRLLPSNRGKGYQSHYVLLLGPNVAIRAESHLRCGGYRRRSFDQTYLDKEIANALRRITPKIGYARRAVVYYSDRCTEAYGVVGTIRWILNRGGHAGVTDVR